MEIIKNKVSVSYQFFLELVARIFYYINRLDATLTVARKTATTLTDFLSTINNRLRQISISQISNRGCTRKVTQEVINEFLMDAKEQQVFQKKKEVDTKRRVCVRWLLFSGSVSWCKRREAGPDLI